MCAVFGWFKPKFQRGANRERLLRQLARKAQAWGDKSFGLAAMIEGEMSVVKYTGSASSWLEQNTKDLKKWASSEVLLGHTRMPTHGAVTKNNCHPFSIGGWVVAHNGVINNASKLMAKAVYVAKGETDSEEALCYVVSKQFAPEALAQIDGYYAFEGLKKDGSEAVLVVDDRASLYTVKLGDGLVWCTSSDVLSSSLEAAGIQHEAPVKLERKILRLPSWDVVQLQTRYERAEMSATVKKSLGIKDEPKFMPKASETYEPEMFD